MRTAVIVNPASGGGRARQLWSRIANHAGERLNAHQVCFTNGRGGAAGLAAELARAGVERIIAAGGDGTIHEAANGLLDAGLGQSVALGILPLGTAGDLARTLGISFHPHTAIEQLHVGAVRTADAARIDFGDGSHRWTMNVGSFGLGGDTVARIAQTRLPLPGQALYLLQAVRSLCTRGPYDLRLALDGREIFAGPATHVAIGIGRFQGGGIHICPRAEIGDGAFDVTVIRAVTLADLLLNLRRLYNGRILEHPRVTHHRGTHLRAECDALAQVEVDGESHGRLPLDARLAPGALRLIAATS